MAVRELITKLGFDVDETKLKKLDTSLDKTKEKVQDVSKSIDTMKKSIKSNLDIAGLSGQGTGKLFIDDKLFLPENSHLLLNAKDTKKYEAKKQDEELKKNAKDVATRIKEANQKIKESYKETAAKVKESNQKIREAAKATGEALAKFSGIVNKTKYAVIGLVGTFTGLSALSLSVAKDTTALDVMAKQLGVTTNDLQELELVAQQSGAEVGLLTKSFTKFNKDINAVNFSSTLTAKEISKLGISVYNVNGKLRDSKDVYSDVAKKINNIQDSSKQAAISQKLFGTSNLALVQTLSLNSEEFAKQRAEVLKLSYVVDSKGIKSSQNFIKSWSQFKMIVNSLKQELAIKFMPVFTDVVNKFKEWYGENRKLISSGIDSSISVISKSFNLLLKTIDLLLIPVKGIINLFGGFENTVQILGITIGIALIPKLLTLITTFRALTLAMLANPIGLATAAFAALGAAVALVYNDINAWMKGNKSLIGYLIDEWDLFGKTVQAVSDIIDGAANRWKDFLDPTGLIRKAYNKKDNKVSKSKENDPIANLETIGKKDYTRDPLVFAQKAEILRKKSFSNSSYMNPATNPTLNDSKTVKNNVTQTIGEVNITVPAGTTQEQAASINQQVVDLMQEQLSQFTLRGLDSLSNR